MNEDKIVLLSSYFYVRGIVVDKEESSLTENIKKAQEIAIKATACLDVLLVNLANAPDDINETDMQAIFYESGKLQFSTELRLWFQIVYEIILKESSGPRLGQFTLMVGKNWIIERINNRLAKPYENY